ncbi:MAG: hypothetical protein LAP38_06730 [Acidobacteriia bacterium]|nr:hypothetical protein [Terriglobia bacterium]
MVTCARLLALFLLGHIGFLAAADPAKTYTIQTVAGTNSVGDGGPALSALLSQAEGVAVDSLGAIYVADADDNRVRKITPDGVIQTVAGTGVAGLAGDGDPANAALLNHPYGVAVDDRGNLYIADLGNARVREVSAGGTIQTIAGGGSVVPGGNGDGGQASIAQLLEPRNVAIGADGSLYISDFGAHRVYQVSAAGILTTLAGTGNAGFSGDGASARLAQLKAPAGVAVDANGVVYIADSGNNRIRKVDHGVISTIFSVVAPTGVAAGGSGSVYIASGSYFGTQYKTVAGVASARDVAVDRAGSAYVTTGQFVRKVNAAGAAATVAGSGEARYFGGDNGSAKAARLHAPSGIAVDDLGNWYVADTANHRVRKITPAGVISTIAGTGDPGAKGDNGPAALAQLNAPRSVAVDSLRNVYVADTGNNEVRRITPGGAISTVLNQLNDPEYVAAGTDQSVYVADAGNNRVVKLTASGTMSTVTQVVQPASIAVDRSGDVFVSGPDSVSKIPAAGGFSTLLDGLQSPRGLAVTPDGDLLIAETGANVIRRVTPSGVVSTIAGTGVAGLSGDDGAAGLAQLNAPLDLAMDANGAIWIADSANNRIRGLTPATAIADDTASTETVVNAATLQAGPVAPGEIVTIFGAGFVADQTQLLFDGRPATIFYTGANQINAMAPADLTPDAATEISILVKGMKIADFSSSVAVATPGIFTAANGTGQAAATNQDGSINSASNPAARGEIVTLYATGQGSSANAVNLTVGGYPCELLYAGPAPGFPGLMQINARVPSGFLGPGIQALALSAGNARSQAGVTIAVR